MRRLNFAILKNETVSEHLNWVEACDKNINRVDYDIIDLVRSDWLDEILAKKYDYLLAKAPGGTAYYKQMYDERIYILNYVLKLPVYPSFNELMIYENKRLLSYFLKARKIPHPETAVFYSKEEALFFSKNCKLPIVAKTNIGAGGSGVRILKTREEVCYYIEKAFSEEGITRNYFPNFRKGDYLNRLKKRLNNLKDTVTYFREKKRAATIEPQKWFVIFQEYIKCDFEWRCVVIGDSYFGHKKVRSIGELMSGTSKVKWDVPDKELLNFIHGIVLSNNLWSQAIDLFYDSKRGYLVNELQCFWGSKNPHQMIMDGKPGRFVFKEGIWCFEEGSFNENNSYDLRIKHLLSLTEEKK